jgi:hypothetical protein
VKRIIGGIEVIMVLNKKQILCYLCLLCVFLFTLTITGKRVEAATQVDGYKHFKHNAYNLQWGYRCFEYSNDYICTVITGFSGGGYTYKAATNQDLASYKTPADIIYPPLIGNGTVVLQGVYLLNTSNNVVNSLGNESFNNGTINWRIVPGGTLWLLSRYSYTWLEGIPNATYRIQVGTTFALPCSWYPFLWTDYTYTPWF